MTRLTSERLAEIEAGIVWRCNRDFRPEAEELMAEVRALTAERDHLQQQLERRTIQRNEGLKVIEAQWEVHGNEAASLRATIAQQAERLAEVEGQAGAMRRALEQIKAGTFSGWIGDLLSSSAGKAMVERLARLEAFARRVLDHFCAPPLESSALANEARKALKESPP